MSEGLITLDELKAKELLEWMVDRGMLDPSSMKGNPVRASLAMINGFNNWQNEPEFDAIQSQLAIILAPIIKGVVDEINPTQDKYVRVTNHVARMFMLGYWFNRYGEKDPQIKQQIMRSKVK